MNRLLAIAIFLILSQASSAFAAFTIPKRTGLVNDFADVFSSKEEKVLNDLLTDFYDRTTNEIVVATFPRLGDEPLDYTIQEIVDAWKLGYKDIANGVVLAFFVEEHEVGLGTALGLDTKIPLSLKRRIIRDTIAPAFRMNQYAVGTKAAVLELIEKIDPTYRFTAVRRPPISIEEKLLYLFLAIFILSMVIDIFSYTHFRFSMSQTRGYAYWREIGRYSFVEWWILYGVVPVAVEFFYFHILRRWINPSFHITSGGSKTTYFNLKTGRGRFFGSGSYGKW